MLISLFKKEKELLTADVEFGLCSIIVNSVFKKEKSTLQLSEELFESWLEERARNVCKGKSDEELLLLLGLDAKKYTYGRISEEAPCLCALLNSFRLSDDNLSIYPSKKELFSLSSLDVRYYQIYSLFPLIH